MKRLVTLALASTVLAVGIIVPAQGQAAPAAPRPAMRVSILSFSPTTITTGKATVTLHLRVSGIVLDAVHLGKANIAGRGHLQLYVDTIPTDAWTKKDLQHTWLASLSATTLSLNLPPALVGGAGKHTIIVALARNNCVLYRTPAARVTITVKK